jgi:nitrate reductase NapE component
VKRRAVEIFLVLFAVWPIFHFALVRHYGTDPWKLFGWAMYSVPGPMKTVRVVGIEEGGELRRLPFDRYTPDEQRLANGFRERRRVLGRLAPPEPLARGMLELHPEFDGVVIAILSLKLDPESALVAARVETSTHWRDGSSGPVELPEGFETSVFAP